MVKTVYACEICSNEYVNSGEALACEQRGVAIPEFKQFEVVELIGLLPGANLTVSSGFKVQFKDGMKCVVHDNASGEWPANHLLPRAYDVWVSTPGGTYLKEVLSGIPREHLKRVRTKFNSYCPLCHSSVFLSGFSSYDYLRLGNGIPTLKNIVASRCQICNVNFFTNRQSSEVTALAKAACKWPIADTKN